MVKTKRKEEVQKEFSRLMGQVKDKLQKFGKELGVFAEKSEKEIVKVSKKGKIQLDIMGLTMQKEKLFYDIGKKVASVNSRKKVDIPGLETYWRKLRSIESDIRKKKKSLTNAKKQG